MRSKRSGSDCREACVRGPRPGACTAAWLLLAIATSFADSSAAADVSLADACREVCASVDMLVSHHTRLLEAADAKTATVNELRRRTRELAATITALGEERAHRRELREQRQGKLWQHQDEKVRLEDEVFFLEELVVDRERALEMLEEAGKKPVAQRDRILALTADARAALQADTARLKELRQILAETKAKVGAAKASLQELGKNPIREDQQRVKAEHKELRQTLATEEEAIASLGRDLGVIDELLTHDAVLLDVVLDAAWTESQRGANALPTEREARTKQFHAWLAAQRRSQPAVLAGGITPLPDQMLGLLETLEPWHAGPGSQETVVRQVGSDRTLHAALAHGFRSRAAEQTAGGYLGVWAKDARALCGVLGDRDVAPGGLAALAPSNKRVRWAVIAFARTLVYAPRLSGTRGEAARFAAASPAGVEWALRTLERYDSWQDTQMSRAVQAGVIQGLHWGKAGGMSTMPYMGMPTRQSPVEPRPHMNFGYGFGPGFAPGGW